MIEWLVPLLILIVLLIKVLDYVGMLEAAVMAILRLIGAAIMGAVKLIAFLFRKLIVASKPQPLPPSAAVSGKDSPGR
jgi:hypothetical protein